MKKGNVSGVALLTAKLGLLGVFGGCDFNADSYETKDVKELSDCTDYPRNLSAETNSNFNFFCDEDEGKKVLYYIPKSAMIANLGFPNTSSPAFAASLIKQSFGPMKGEETPIIGGKFSFAGPYGQVEKLYKEADSEGYRARPAPISGVRIDWAIAAHQVNADGRVESKCDIDAGGNPQCRIKDQNGQFNIDVNSVLSASTFAPGESIVSDVGFQAQFVPGATETIRKKLTGGVNWEDFVQPQVTWEVKRVGRIHRADIHLKFKSVYEFFRSYTYSHPNSCREDELSESWDKLTQCTNVDECGFEITWYDSAGKKTTRPDVNAGLHEAIEAIRSKYETMFWAPIVTPPTSKASVSNEKNTSLQFLRRQLSDKHITDVDYKTTIYYIDRPENDHVKMTTSASISCIKGDLNEKMRFDLADPSCAGLIGGESKN